MNCKILFLKRAKVSELPILFVKIILLYYNGRDERVLEKSMFDIELRNVVDIISCSICFPSGGDFIKQTLRELIFSYFKEIAKIFKPPPLL